MSDTPECDVLVVEVVAVFEQDASATFEFLLLRLVQARVIDEIGNDDIFARHIDHAVGTAIEGGVTIFPVVLQNTVEGFTGTQVLLLLRIQRCFQLIVEQELGNGQRALHFEAYLAFLGFVLFWTDRVHTCERDILPCLDAKRIKPRTILA